MSLLILTITAAFFITLGWSIVGLVSWGWPCLFFIIWLVACYKYGKQHEKEVHK